MLLAGSELQGKKISSSSVTSALPSQPVAVLPEREIAAQAFFNLILS